jgi:hypothetical protein
MDRASGENIVFAFKAILGTGTILEASQVADVNELPYPKERIREALYWMFRNANLVFNAAQNINPLPQFPSRLEVWNALSPHSHVLSSSRVSPCTRLTIISGETAEATYFNSITLCKGIRQGFEEQRDAELDILGGELGKMNSKGFDEVWAVHPAILSGATSPE